MLKHYQNPPLLEAICEFKFQPSANWKPGVVDLIYEKVQAQFPRRETMHGLNGNEPASNARTKFFRADGSALLQVSPKLLAINQLRPYASWRQFKQTILETYSLYRDIAPLASIARLGLRYINQIEIPGTKIEIGRYLRGCPEGYHKLFLSTAFPFEAERENLAMIVAHVPHNEGDFLRFYLDLDYGAFPQAAEEIGSALERAHDRIEKIFEASITDESRRLFGWERKAQPYREAQAPPAVDVVRETQAPYGKPAAATPVQNFLPAPPIAESATPKVTASAVAINFAEFYDERLQELGENFGKSAEEREAERWEQLEMEMGVEKEIMFKEPTVPTRLIKARVQNCGPAPVPDFLFDDLNYLLEE
jgi:uncharacterized protein (TIGR04255 family)